MLKWKRQVALLLVIMMAFTNTNIPATAVYAAETEAESGGGGTASSDAYTTAVYNTVLDTGVSGDNKYQSVAKIDPDGAGGNAAFVETLSVTLSDSAKLGTVSLVKDDASAFQLKDSKKYIVYDSALVEVTDANVATYFAKANQSKFETTVNGLSGWDSTNSCPIIYCIYAGSYNVTFTATYGGKVSQASTTVAYGQKLNSLPTTTANTGYQFTGWSMDGFSYTKEDLLAYAFTGSSKNVIIVANFAKETHTIHIDFYEGYSTDYKVDIDTDLNALYNIMVSDAEREGHKFVGFVDGEGEVITAASLSRTSNASYTAKYEKLVAYNNLTYHNGDKQTTQIVANVAVVDITISDVEVANTFNMAGNTLASYPMFESDGQKWVVVSRVANQTFRALYYGQDGATEETGEDILNRCVADANGVYSVSDLDTKPFVYSYMNGGEAKTCSATAVTFVAHPFSSENGLLEVSKKGYTFDGWYTSVTGGEQITDIASLDSLNVDLYAHFTPITYTISLDVDGGVLGDGVDTEYTYDVENGFAIDGVTASLVLPTPTRSHHTFDGWYYTDEDGKGHKVSAVYYASAFMDFDLKAKWTPIQYRILYDLDGGKIEDAPNYHTYGQSDLVIPTPTKNGYVFDAWYVDVTLETPLEDIGSYDRQVTLYAKWQARTFKIDYVLNGGVGNTHNPTNYISGKEPLIYNPSRANYSFVGWYTDEALTKQMTEADFASGSDITLYAKWLGNKYTITYDFKGATAITEPTYFRFGTAPALMSPTKKGYIFQGWFFDEACTNKATETSVEWSTASNVKLYAGWKSCWYKISYKLNGGTIKKAPQSFTYEIPADIPNPKRKGYLFLGWYTDSKCKTKLTNASYNNASDITVYAKWQKCKPAKSKVSKLKSKSKGKIEVKIKKQNKIDGYQIRYATNKKFTKAKKKYTDSTTLTLKKLKSGQVYYVQVRTYIVDSSNEMVYSKWSKIKTVRVK